MMMRIVYALGVVLLGCSAHAGNIQFSPAGGAGPAVQIGSIDAGVGNALARGLLPATVGATFQLDYQAQIAALIDPNGLPLALPGTTQLTAVGSFTEVVTGVQPGGAVTFALAASQAPASTFAIYSNPTVTVNVLAGTGFTDGTQILVGKPDPTLTNGGGYALAQASLVPFDQFHTNDYPGVSTVVGSGSVQLALTVTSFDPAYFKTPVSTAFFNSSLVAPFAESDPSRLFGSIAPSIGAVNGLSGPDFQLQADGNLAFTPSAGGRSGGGGGSIPEPAGILQAGLGLLAVMAMVLAGRRR